MDKQQLASKIMQSADNLRGNMEASKYKDYILSLIFYKFLSDKQFNFLVKQGMSDDEIMGVTEEDTEYVEYIHNNLGYFLEPRNFFRTWINNPSDFTMGNLTDSLNAYERNLNPAHKHLYSGIFNTLSQGLSSLGSKASDQRKAVLDIMDIIRDIPTDNSTDYDVLGYVYEFLIGHFAANAGKKAGEFYTPSEVATVMAKIVANHVKDKDKIQIFDPTSGSASLLLNIGREASQYLASPDQIKYYAQEKIDTTYNLTRMNLIMRGIKPDNMVVRNGDTLERDFPFFSDNDPDGTYETVFVDACVSNPPYSQKYNPEPLEHDPRFADYGLAPKSKADYAFLLHGLYHLKPDGILTIVLPHGVIFRGGEEGQIRTNLVNKNNIDAVIGLPANIFFGTGIPTIIMVLKKQRLSEDILFIDASKGFDKSGTKNKLRSSDIQKIVDTYINRENIENYSRNVTLNEIRENEYNLNIPRYVDSSDEEEVWDPYAVMNGGIPVSELNSSLSKVWKQFPSLYNELFDRINEDYVDLKSDNLVDIIENNAEVISFKANYQKLVRNYTDYMQDELLKNMHSIHSVRGQEQFKTYLFQTLEEVQLLDSYQAYQHLANIWSEIEGDLEVIQTESIESVRKVDPNMIIKKVKDKDTEVQSGFRGRVAPFELIQSLYFNNTLMTIQELEENQASIQNELTELVGTLSEEDGEYDVLNDKNDAFKLAKVTSTLSDLFEDVSTPEMVGLNQYIQLLDNKANKSEKEQFMHNHKEVKWSNIEKSKNGTISKANTNKYLKELQQQYTFEQESFGATLSRVIQLNDEEKEIKLHLKELNDKLINNTIAKIESLTDEEINQVLTAKWVNPLKKNLDTLADNFISNLEDKLLKLNGKYSTSVETIDQQIKSVSQELTQQLSQLRGSDSDMAGIQTFIGLLGGV